MIRQLTTAALVAAAGCGGQAHTGSVNEQEAGQPAGVEQEDTRVEANAGQARRLHTSQISGFEEAAERIIDSAAEFASVWQQVAEMDPGAALPQVDFGRESVVLLALGSRPTGGYNIRYDSHSSAGGETTIHYTTESPGPECMLMQMMSSPVDIVAIPRVREPVRFEATRRVVPC